MFFFTPEAFDMLIIIVVLIGGALAVVRLYRDFTRPLPANGDEAWMLEETDPHTADDVFSDVGDESGRSQN